MSFYSFGLKLVQIIDYHLIMTGTPKYPIGHEMAGKSIYEPFLQLPSHPRFHTIIETLYV